MTTTPKTTGETASTLKIDFSCPRSIREFVLAKAAERKEVLDTEALEKWVHTVSEKERALGRLMTDQQYADWRLGRRLSVGDRARYVASARQETVRVPDGTERRVLRPYGQVGIMLMVEALEIMAPREERKIQASFRPDGPAPYMGLPPDAKNDGAIVTLHATALLGSGWPLLERIPAPGEETS